MPDQKIQKFIFRLLQDGEKIYFIHKHYWFAHLQSIILSLFLLSLSFFLMYGLISQGLWGLYVFIGLLILSIFVCFRTYFYWYFNVVVFTDKRIIDIDQINIWSRSISEITYENIQDISYKQSGFFEFFLKYGNLHIKTANSDSKGIDVHHVKNPEKLHEIITLALKEHQEKKQSPLSDANLVKMIHVLKQKFKKEELLEIFKTDEESDFESR